MSLPLYLPRYIKVFVHVVSGKMIGALMRPQSLLICGDEDMLCSPDQLILTGLPKSCGEYIPKYYLQPGSVIETKYHNLASPSPCMISLSYYTEAEDALRNEKTALDSSSMGV